LINIFVHGAKTMTFEPIPQHLIPRLISQNLSRRELLRGAIVAASTLCLPFLAQVSALADDPPQKTAFRPGSIRMANLYAPFRMGIQSYSLRHFSMDDMLAKTRELGLTFLEAYPMHFPVTTDTKTLDSYKDKLKASNIQLVAYGVVDFSADEADARKKFEFGKAMGVETLTAYPRPEALPLLDKLAEEYKINVAIHNHGPGDNLYDMEDKLLKAFEGRGPRIGSCCDTGHYLRSGVNPVQVVKDIGPRLFDIHLKSVKIGANGQKAFTEIGTTGGLLDTLALFRKLIEQNYKGVIMLEYEDHPEDPMQPIKDCLAATQRIARTAREVGLVPK
jgi:sugar phosphate isomerase/epimerase